MSHNSPALDPLVYTFVPESRNSESLKIELVAHCHDILKSYIGHRAETPFYQLTDLVKRRLLQLSPNGTSASKFANLVARLLDQPVLSRKQETILFLFTLSSLNIAPAPTIQMPTLKRTSVKLQEIPAVINPINHLGNALCSNAKRVKDFRLHKGITQIDETLLVRDNLYLMQGISGKYVRFSSSSHSEKKLVFANDPNKFISLPNQALMHRLAELGYLYSRVEMFVLERENAAGVGMIEQSLCHYLQTQLTGYYRLIALLETQLSSGHSESEDLDDHRNDEIRLSLRRLDVWVTEWRLRMRMMSVCVEGARESHGGALVNLIHSYTDNGDPFVRKFTDELLEEVSRPFFATLHKWLFSGELYDPYEEFFVAVDSNLERVSYVHPSSIPGRIDYISNDGIFGGLHVPHDDASIQRDTGQQLWETKYSFRKDMLPMFVGESFGKKIFSTGKSLNFIRYSCLDSDWVVTREKMSNTSGTLEYGDIAGLERSIDVAYQLASHRLFEVLIDKFRLLDHLSALKHFLLLSHGDFADQLMETLGPSLSRPANTLYRHNLTANLETAVRSSNPEDKAADVLRRLDARMLEYSHGEIGWDVFTLEYKVDAPIDTVLDQGAMENYLKLFKHLWYLKRIEKTLDKGWLRVTANARTFIRLPKLGPHWHKIRLAMSEMIHFIRQLEAYCRLEVIECSWKVLVDFLNKKEGDLDALIDAHRTYLETTTKKILLWNSKIGKEETLLRHLMEIFAIILQFREATDTFYNYCLTESARKDQELDIERGVFTGHPQPPQGPEAVFDRILEYASSFTDKVQTIVQLLQVHPDLDCRFLGIRISFSDFYKSKKDTQNAKS